MIPKPDRLPDLELVGYLHRWCLVPRNRECNIYLHHIIGPDEPVMHDHPWRFKSIILNGEYLEFTDNGAQIRTAGFSHTMEARDSHFIEHVAPDTWTLIITGPIEREWGFWIDNQWVHHRDYEGRGQRFEVIKRNGYEDE